MNIASLILAAGKGTRMKSKLPKVLHKVGGKAMVERVLETVQSIGTNRDVVIVGFGGDAVQNYLGERAEFVRQEEQNGTGHAVKMAQPVLDDYDGTILLLCGDTPLVTKESLEALLEEHKNSGAAATTAATATTEKQTTEAKAEETTKEAATEAKSADADLSGSISMVGSTSMEKFANALSEAFMEKYPKVTVTAEFVGSGAGIEAVSNGTADIGNSSRNLKDEEKAKGVAENIVAIDGIAVVVDPANTVEDLTKDQLTSIYDGTVTNWKDVGGNDAPIVVVGREAGSGTRGAFEELLKLEDACKYSNELDSTGAVMAKVASTPGSIGYVSLDVLDDTVKALKLDGAEPTEENIKAGKYFLSRPFVMATKGEISEQSDLVKALFDFIYSDEGSELVKSVGLITADK